MGLQPSWILKLLMLMTWSSSLMRQAPSDVGLTFKVFGFITPGKQHQRLSPKVSIQWQELFAILAAALAWGHKWRTKRIKFNCDNQAIVLAWQGRTKNNVLAEDAIPHCCTA